MQENIGHHRLRTHGFSLVELSIVLVILGLLVGGVLAGQSLIRASEIRGISAESQRYAAAVYAFRDKYFALPGDMRNATQFWSFAGTTVSPGCVTNSAAMVAVPGTCDGNGDGIIADGTAASTTGESYQGWKQLALAGIIEGSYSGNSGAAGSFDYVIATNSPRSKISNAGWMLTYFNNAGGSNGHPFNYDYRNWIAVGSGSGTGSWADDGFLKNEEAWNIDTKLDDGRPGTGGVHAMGLDTNCTDTTSASNRNAVYQLDRTLTSACALLFRGN